MPMIRVKVRYLGTFSQLTGRREEALELGAGATVGDLSKRLVAKHGRELQKRLADPSTRAVLFVIRNEPVGPERVLQDGDEVLLTYPAGGG